MDSFIFYGDYAKASELKYGKIVQLEKQLADLQAETAKNNLALRINAVSACPCIFRASAPTGT